MDEEARVPAFAFDAPHEGSEVEADDFDAFDGGAGALAGLVGVEHEVTPGKLDSPAHGIAENFAHGEVEQTRELRFEQ